MKTSGMDNSAPKNKSKKSATVPAKEIVLTIPPFI
jgi:hypothetical protein